MELNSKSIRRTWRSHFVTEGDMFFMSMGAWGLIFRCAGLVLSEPRDSATFILFRLR